MMTALGSCLLPTALCDGDSIEATNVGCVQSSRHCYYRTSRRVSRFSPSRSQSGASRTSSALICLVFRRHRGVVSAGDRTIHTRCIASARGRNQPSHKRTSDRSNPLVFGRFQALLKCLSPSRFAAVGASSARDSNSRTTALRPNARPAQRGFAHPVAGVTAFV
jgi:hypothetical protein